MGGLKGRLKGRGLERELKGGLKGVPRAGSRRLRRGQAQVPEGSGRFRRRVLVQRGFRCVQVWCVRPHR